MQKITVRRIVLGGILLCISLMALFTLFFNVLSLVNSEILEEVRKIYNIRIADNGYALMSGDSVFLSELSDFSSDGHYISGIDSLIVVSEIFTIVFIVVGAVSVIFSVLWFFTGKQTFSHVAISSAVFVVLGYLVLSVGIRITAIEGYTFEVQSGEGVIFGDYFDYIIYHSGVETPTRMQIRRVVSDNLKTFAYVPTIIVGILVAAYSIINFLFEKTRDVAVKNAFSSTIAQNDGLNASNVFRAEYKDSFDKDVNLHRLRELKQLFDDGILTEEEFTEQKRLVLGKHE